MNKLGRLDRDERADICGQQLAFVFLGTNLLARTTALEDVELPMLYNPRKLSTRRMCGQDLECL